MGPVKLPDALLNEAPADPAGPGRAPQGAPTRRGKVLVVDDEPMIIRVIERVLKPEHDLTAVGLASLALEKILAGERFDVILCDLMMPEMTGMALHAELIRLAPEQAGRMVFLSGGAFTSEAREFLDASHRPRLEKPFSAQALRALVNALVRS